MPAKQVTLLHYQDDLGLPLELARLVPVETPAASAPAREPAPPADVAAAEAVPATASGLRLRRTSGEGEAKGPVPPP